MANKWSHSILHTTYSRKTLTPNLIVLLVCDWTQASCAPNSAVTSSINLLNNATVQYRRYAIVDWLTRLTHSQQLLSVVYYLINSKISRFILFLQFATKPEHTRTKRSRYYVILSITAILYPWDYYYSLFFFRNQCYNNTTNDHRKWLSMGITYYSINT